MSKAQKPLIIVRNRLLRALPEDEYNRLLPDLDPVELPQGKIIYKPRAIITHVYFPNNAAVSLLSVSEEGTTVEVGLIGYEGMVGLPIFHRANNMPYQTMVQIGGNGMRMSAPTFRDFLKRSEALIELLFRYTHVYTIQIKQSRICNLRHTVEERFCKWLLESLDRTESDTLFFTQELLAQILGAERSNVGRASTSLVRMELIRTGRGWITIIDRKGLEEVACECYGTMESSRKSLTPS